MTNGILMTYYMFPLLEKKEILNDIYFDNPREVEEINQVSQILKKANSFSFSIPISDNEDLGNYNLSLEFIRDEFNKKYKINCDIDEDIYDYLAKNWVIIRFSNQKIKGYLSSSDITNSDIERGYQIRNSQYLKYYRAIRLINILSFITFFNDIENEHSIIVSNNFELLDINYKEYQLKILLINTIITLKDNETNVDEFKNCQFDLIYEKLKANEHLLLDKENDDLIMYIADSLEIYQNMEDIKMKITSLVSIIELLIAHNPDSSRYNVEDSIRKQFASRILVILHLNKKITNVLEIEKLLLLIYDLRSSISHGSFDKISFICEKIAKWQLKNDKDSIRYEEKSNQFEVMLYVNRVLRNYLRIMLKHYLSDKVLFEILKK